MNDSTPPLNPEIWPKIQGWLSTPICEHDLFTPHTQYTQGRTDNPVQNSTAQHYLYTATHLVLSKSTCFWGGDFSAPSNPNQQTELSLTRPGTWSEGVWQVKGHHTSNILAPETRESHQHRKGSKYIHKKMTQPSKHCTTQWYTKLRADGVGTQ